MPAPASTRGRVLGEHVGLVAGVEADHDARPRGRDGARGARRPARPPPAGPRPGSCGSGPAPSAPRSPAVPNCEPGAEPLGELGGGRALPGGPQMSWTSSSRVSALGIGREPGLDPVTEVRSRASRGRDLPGGRRCPRTGSHGVSGARTVTASRSSPGPSARRDARRRAHRSKSPPLRRSSAGPSPARDLASSTTSTGRRCSPTTSCAHVLRVDGLLVFDDGLVERIERGERSRWARRRRSRPGGRRRPHRRLPSAAGTRGRRFARALDDRRDPLVPRRRGAGPRRAPRGQGQLAAVPLCGRAGGAPASRRPGRVTGGFQSTLPRATRSPAGGDSGEELPATIAGIS